MKPSAKTAVNPAFPPARAASAPGYDVNSTVVVCTLVALTGARWARTFSVGLRPHCGILGLPDGYRVGIVPASDTGAFELAMWSLLGAAAG